MCPFARTASAQLQRVVAVLDVQRLDDEALRPRFDAPGDERIDTLVDLAARAAIEAMREPTEAMESAAWGSCDVWRAMIDAALTSDPVAP